MKPWLLVALLALSVWALDDACSQHGFVLPDSTCDCVHPYALTDCSFHNATMMTEVVYSGYAGLKRWNDFFFDAVVGGNYNSLTITMTRGWAEADPDLYVKFGSKPTTSSYDRADLSSGATHSIVIDGDDLQTGRYYIGVFGFTAANYSISVTAAKTCPNNCNGHGDCVDGVCKCYWGYTANCDRMVVPDQGEWRYADVAKSAMLYATITVDTDLTSRLRVEVEDISDPHATPSLYLRFGADPSTWMYDLRNQTQVNQTQIQLAVPASGIEIKSGSWVVGVYGRLAPATFRWRYYAVDTIELQEKQPATGEVAYHHMNVYLYYLNLFQHNDLRVALTWTQPTKGPQPEIYLRYGAPPTRYVYDFANTTDAPAITLDLHMPDINKTGNYYIGVYGSDPNEQTAPYSIVASSSLNCYMNCNPPHGTCNGDTGVCACHDNYLGEGCTIAVSDPLPVGQVARQTALARGEWACYYTYVDAFTVEVTATLHEQADEIDVDLYMRMSDFPTQLTYDDRDISVETPSRVSLHTPKLKAGLIYTCAYAYRGPAAFNLTINTSTSACEADCSGHGTCDKTAAKCTCDLGWAGDSCAYPAYEIKPNGVFFTDKVVAKSWHYYYFDLDLTAAGAANDIIFALNVTAGDPDLYIKVNGYPSWFNSDWSDLSQDAYSELRVHTPELISGRYWLAVYAFRGAGAADEAVFNLKADAAVRCRDDCSGHGTCNTGGTCKCVQGWALDNCASPNVPVNNGVPTDATVAKGTWSFFNIAVPDDDNDLTVHLSYTGLSEPNLFLRAGDLPDKVHFDAADFYSADRSTLDVHKHGDIAGTWYIGVYANGLFAATVTLTATHSTVCPDDCEASLAHGHCDTNKGVCSCAPGWWGDDCGAIDTVMPLYQGTSLTIRPDHWAYLAYHAQKDAIHTLTFKCDSQAGPVALFYHDEYRPDHFHYLAANLSAVGAPAAKPASIQLVLQHSDIVDGYIWVGVYNPSKDAPLSFTVTPVSDDICPKQCFQRSPCSAAGVCTDCKWPYYGAACWAPIELTESYVWVSPSLSVADPTAIYKYTRTDNSDLVLMRASSKCGSKVEIFVQPNGAPSRAKHTWAAPASAAAELAIPHTLLDAGTDYFFAVTAAEGAALPCDVQVVFQSQGSCHTYQTCGSCVANAQCGWCAGSGCLLGAGHGPTPLPGQVPVAPTCPVSHWFFEQCTTPVGPTPTPTPSKPAPASNGGAIAAGILIPLFVIGGAVGAFFGIRWWRRRQTGGRERNTYAPIGAAQGGEESIALEGHEAAAEADLQALAGHV